MDEVNINMSPRTANHTADRLALSKQGNSYKKFESMEELEKDFKEAYAHLNENDQKYLKEKEADRLNGLDIDDADSIANFEVNYTPLGSTLLVKFLREDDLGSKIIILDSTAKIKKGLVIQPGVFVDYLKKGDIISLRNERDARQPLPDAIEHKFNGITLKEINYESCAGIFMKAKDFRKRQMEDIKRRKLEEGA